MIDWWWQPHCLWQDKEEVLMGPSHPREALPSYNPVCTWLASAVSNSLSKQGWKNCAKLQKVEARWALKQRTRKGDLHRLNLTPHHWHNLWLLDPDVGCGKLVVLGQRVVQLCTVLMFPFNFIYIFANILVADWALLLSLCFEFSVPLSESWMSLNSTSFCS